ncbi:hypothetical protein PLUTE_b0095 [Pseudoalteromonas luteoviolacea DSM 6061]|nr:hypothetical protein [Pseudoalteromonas luteoviolacea DSM 6061]
MSLDDTAKGQLPRQFSIMVYVRPILDMNVQHICVLKLTQINQCNRN